MDVEVTVLSAEGLPVGPFSAGDSAFVTVCMGPDNVMFPCLDPAGGSSPHWNQALRITLTAKAVVPASSFSVRVHRKSVFGKRVVATATVPLSDVVSGFETTTRVVRLLNYRLKDGRGESKGIINLAVKLEGGPADSVARWLAPPLDKIREAEMELNELMSPKKMDKRSAYLEITGLSAEDFWVRRRSLVPRNAYVVVRTGPAASKSTSIVRNGGRHPCWDDMLRLPLPATGWHSFTVEVRYKSAFGDTAIGAAVVPMSDIVANYVPAHLVHFLSYRLWHRSGRPNGIINLAVKMVDNKNTSTLGRQAAGDAGAVTGEGAGDGKISD